MYMIAYKYELENLKDYELEVEVPRELTSFFRRGGKNPLPLLSH